MNHFDRGDMEQVVLILQIYELTSSQIEKCLSRVLCRSGDGGIKLLLHEHTPTQDNPPSPPNTQTHSSISVSIWNLFCFDLAIELCNDCKFVMLRLSPTEVWELSPPLSLFDSSKYFNCPQDKDQIRNPTHTSHAQIFCISHQQRFARSDFFLPNATRCLAKLPAPCTMEASAWGTEQIISFHLILRQLVCLFEFLYGSWKCRELLSNNTCQTSSWQTKNFEDVLLSFVLPRANISFTAPSKQQDDKQSWTRLHFLVAKCQLKHIWPSVSMETRGYVT